MKPGEVEPIEKRFTYFSFIILAIIILFPSFLLFPEAALLGVGLIILGAVFFITGILGVFTKIDQELIMMFFFVGFFGIMGILISLLIVQDNMFYGASVPFAVFLIGFTIILLYIGTVNRLMLREKNNEKGEAGG